MKHFFTSVILDILKREFGKAGGEIFERSPLLQYMNIKTRSANKGSKARGSFANLYALYVLIEDYLKQGYPETGDYSSYDGAIFTKLFKRQRELPFGSKLQNHALNHRLNEEFRKYFSTIDFIPILRNVETNRYWINENLIRINFEGSNYNLAKSIVKIIETYIQTKKSAFESFIKTCEEIKKIEAIGAKDQKTTETFIMNLLAPNVDARLFEIVSYSILRFYYYNQTVFFGFKEDEIEKANLKLYKTGRTNANDGGIDFVMKPLGRFFQVTETLDVKKYFLDIDKIEKYPITFVIKSTENIATLRDNLKKTAIQQYTIKAFVERYMCVSRS